MKKILVIIFSIFLLVACSSSDSKEEKEDNGETGIEVNKGLLNVEITLPEFFFEDDELEEIEAEMKEEHNANVTQNDDGSITVKMSKQEHKELMGEMQGEFIDTIDHIIVDEQYESINDITYNRDFSEINIYVERELFENSLDGLALFSLGFTSLIYQAFDGKDLMKDKVTMKVIDGTTNDEIETVVYPDVFDELLDEMDDEEN